MKMTDYVSDNDKEIKRIMEELSFQTEEEKAEEERENTKAWEEQFKRLTDEKNNTMIWDPAKKKERSYIKCKEDYGMELADKIYAVRKKDGRIEKEDYKELMQMKFKPKTYVGETPKTKRKQFIPIDYEVLYSPKIMAKLSKNLAIYMYLKGRIVRRTYAGDKLSLYENYFIKGRLASSSSIRQMVAGLGLCNSTIIKQINNMKNNGIIEVEKIAPKSSFDNRIHSIYILGTIDLNRKETYFTDRLL